MRYLTLFHHEVGNDWSYIHEKSFKDLAPALSGKIAKPEEGLHISCYYCRKELTEPGALIFGIPNDKEIIFVTKKHICKDCYSRLEIGKPEGGIMPKLTPCPACGDLHKEPIEPKVINEKAQISNQQVIKPEPLKIEELKEFHLKDFEKCKIDQATINSLLELKINELIRIIKQLNKG